MAELTLALVEIFMKSGPPLHAYADPVEVRQFINIVSSGGSEIAALSGWQDAALQSPKHIVTVCDQISAVLVEFETAKVASKVIVGNDGKMAKITF